MVRPGKLLGGGTCQTCIMLEGSSKGSGRRSTALTTEKIAVLAPMPKASTTMAAAEKAGLRRSKRKEKRKSESKFRRDTKAPSLCTAHAERHCLRRTKWLKVPRHSCEFDAAFPKALRFAGPSVQNCLRVA